MSRRYAGLVTGTARFTADVAADAAALVFVRSPHARARIVDIDRSAAAAVPGVLGVFVAADLGLVPIWEINIVPEALAQPPLAVDEVRYVGERVVAVAASDLATALDAAEAVVVEYEPLPAVLSVHDAAQPASGRVHASLEDNVALAWDEQVAQPASPHDEVTVRGTVALPRLGVAPMEGLAILAVPDGAGLDVYASTQCPGAVRVQTARSLRMPLEALRVRTPRVGGGFGGKALGGVADYAVTAAVARRLGTAVRFVEDRSANLTTMHGRGVHLTYEMTAARDGRVSRLAVRERCDAGAYASTNSVEPGKTHIMACGPYRIGALAFTAQSLLTNLPPNGAYRGPGRSEATMVLERGLDRLAATIGVDRVEIRHRNLLHAAELPYTTPGGAHLADTDMPALLDEMVQRLGYDELLAEQAVRRASGDRYRLGIGISTAVDSSAWFQRDESAIAELDDDGRLVIHVASASAGQEHTGLFARCAAEALGLDASCIEVVEGDTRRIAGYGSSGSRTTQLAASAAPEAAHELGDRLRSAAASVLECDPADVVLGARGVHVAGVPARELTYRDLASGCGAITVQGTFEQPQATYPSAALGAVVELDTETGHVRVRRVHAVVDCGTVIDPPGAHGQVVGAVAQAIGQVLYEEMVHDEQGTPLTTNLADYAVPSAAEVPFIDVHFRPTPASTNPLGAKGVGEIGMIAGPAALVGAVVDALGDPFTELEVPCTPARVWSLSTGRPRGDTGRRC